MRAAIGESLVMGHEDEGETVPVPALEEEIGKIEACLLIEIARRLIGQEKPG